MYECLKLNSQSYKQWPSLPFDKFKKAWKSVISGASKWTHLTLQCFTKIAAKCYVAHSTEQHLLPWLTSLGPLSVQSLNGTAKRQKGSRMNSAAGFSEGNGQQWRQHCQASLNSAILCASPHSRNPVLLHKEGKQILPTSTHGKRKTVPLPSDYSLRNTHPVPQPSNGTTSTSFIIVVIACMLGHNLFYPSLLG